MFPLKTALHNIGLYSNYTFPKGRRRYTNMMESHFNNVVRKLSGKTEHADTVTVKYEGFIE